MEFQSVEYHVFDLLRPLVFPRVLLVLDCKESCRRRVCFCSIETVMRGLGDCCAFAGSLVSLSSSMRTAMPEEWCSTELDCSTLTRAFSMRSRQA